MLTTYTNAFGQPYLQMQWEEANDWIYVRWQGLLSTDNVIKGGEYILEMMQQTGCSSLLNDNRDITGSWNQANDHIAQHWMPRALALGLRRFAHVLAPGVFGQTSAEEMQRRAADQFQMALFPDLESAQAWLRAA